ncbi:hypothetical protein AHM74_004215 [Salmonella enterica subsp. enterica serovar Oranienburg]|nr:hypothetical protein [Salmonella enterica subsp. enterica serovar Oranienburg]
MYFAASGSMVQKITSECIWICQKAYWLKNELCCQWQHGIKNDQRLYLGLPESVLVKK